MALFILQKANQYSLPLNTSSFTGNPVVDAQLAYVQGLVGGRVVGLNSSGYVALADGNEANDIVPFGFIINDAAGYSFENTPALASGLVSVSFGNAILQSDQIDTAITIAPGDKLYAGTSTKVGLLTNVAPSNSRPIGIALSAASSAAPTVTFAVLS